MNNKDIIIIDEWVEMRWNGSTRSRYMGLGYKFTKIGDTFLCKVEDLSYGSRVSVLVKCPVCNESRFIEYGKIARTGHTKCMFCTRVHPRLNTTAQMIKVGGRRILNRTGVRFGRLIVVSLNEEKTAEMGVNYWNCLCDCGNTTVVYGGSLQRGNTQSCGCYSKEVHSGPRKKGNRSRKKSSARRKLLSKMTEEHKLWRKRVYKRDNYTCQRCGATGGDLNAHHKHGIATHPELAFDIDNGITLCKPCHDDFHLRFMGAFQNPCTAEDCEEWLSQPAN